MLEINFIKENKDLVVKSLSKRNLDSSFMIESVIEIDIKKRKIQTELDSLLHQLNLISKDIGDLFKKGLQKEAQILKEKTVKLKENSKKLNDDLINELPNSLTTRWFGGNGGAWPEAQRRTPPALRLRPRVQGHSLLVDINTCHRIDQF